MYDELNDVFDDSDSNIEELQLRVEELEQRLEEFEQKLDHIKESSQAAGIGLYGLGTILAVVLSWSRNASILWSILHGIFSWFYVIYFAFTRT